MLPRPIPLGSRWRTTSGNFPALDCYLLLVFHVGGDGAAMCSPRAIKKDFRALGWLVMESGAQVVLSSIFPVSGSYMGWNRWDLPLKHGSTADATDSFGFFDNGMVYTAPGTLVSDGIHISQRGKRGLSLKASGTQWQSFKLDLKGKGDNTRIVRGKLWDDTPRLEGQGAGESSQPVALRSAGCTEALEALQRWAIVSQKKVVKERKHPPHAEQSWQMGNKGRGEGWCTQQDHGTGAPTSYVKAHRGQGDDLRQPA